MTGADNGSNDRRDEGAGGIVSLAVSPDGRCFVTAAYECDIALWDTYTGTHIITLEDASGIHVQSDPSVSIPCVSITSR